MKKIVSLLLAVMMLLGTVAAMVSCSAPKDNGAEFDIYLGNEVCDFDPSDYYADSTAEQVMSLLFEPLFSINDDGKLELAAAKDYDIDYEKRQIVIELRESYWSDEVRVCAADFIYAWCERLLNPNNPNPAAALLYEIENAMDVKSGVGTVSDIGARATGIDEITITYRDGGDPARLIRNLASVATAPVRQDRVEAAPSYWSKLVDTMVFSGPFAVKAYDTTTGQFSLERNRGYHQSPDSKNFSKQVTPGTLFNFFTIFGEEMTLTTADIENKTTFFMTEAPLADRQANKDKAICADSMSAYSYVFNVQNPLFAIPEVRQALLISIDRKAIAEALTFAKPADGVLPDVCGGSSEQLISSESKLAEAEALLANVNFTGISKSFSITCANNEDEIKIAELVSATWKSLGFNVTVKTVGRTLNRVNEVEFYDSRVQALVKEASFGNYQFDVLGIDWQFYSDDAFTGLAAFTSAMNGCGIDFTANSQRANIAGYSSLEYDSLIVEAMKLNGDERAEVLAEAEKLLCTDAAFCPIVFNQSFAFVSEELRNVEVDAFGHFVLTEADLKNYEEYLEE